MTQYRTGSPVPQKSRAALKLLTMRKSSIAILLAFLALPLWAQDTGWLNPSQDSGDFTFGWRAYYNDNKSAIVLSVWEVISHDYWGYGINLPPGVRVTGIEVRLDAWHWRFGWEWESYLWVELSWDGGESWTSTGYGTGRLPLQETTFVLGGSSDLWGRPEWRPNELNDQNFRVRIFGIGSARLDWVAVRVYYSTALVLEVEPRTVNLGTLTLADYDRGYRESLETQIVSLTSPATWTLYIAASSPTWNYTGDLPDPKKPCEHLLWRVEYATGSVSSATQTYTPLATTDRMVANGSAGQAQLSLSFRLLVDYETTVPGTCTLDFRYTLVTP